MWLLVKRFAYFLAAFAVLTIAQTAAAADEDRVATHDVPRFRVEASGGPVIGSIANIPFWGAKVSAGVDIAARKNFSFAVDAFYTNTRTDADLGMQWGGVSTGALWTPSRFRIGAGFDVFYFDLTRATNGDALTHPGVGTHAHLGVDLLQVDGGYGVELAAVPEVDWLFGVPLAQGSLVLAARF